MIDHTGLNVSDYQKSKAFYLAALAPLGYQVVMEMPSSIVPLGGMGLGVPPKPDFWVGGGKPNVPPLHVAFRAQNRAQVDAFYKAALAAGGRDNGPPALEGTITLTTMARSCSIRWAQHRSGLSRPAGLIAVNFGHLMEWHTHAWHARPVRRRCCW